MPASAKCQTKVQKSFPLLPPHLHSPSFLLPWTPLLSPILPPPRSFSSDAGRAGERLLPGNCSHTIPSRPFLSGAWGSQWWPPSTRGTQLPPKSPTDSAHRSTPAVTHCGGHTWSKGGHPRTSCFQSTEHQSAGDARKKAPRQHPEALPSAPGVQPGSHPLTGQLGCKHRSEVSGLEPESGSFSLRPPHLPLWEGGWSPSCMRTWENIGCITMFIRSSLSQVNCPQFLRRTILRYDLQTRNQPGCVSLPVVPPKKYIQIILSFFFFFYHFLIADSNNLYNK